jgi:nucleoid-associated protein YgaU
VIRAYPEPPTPAADAGTDDEKPKVALETVDYDDKGKVVFSGKAEPGGTVRIYVDNELAGQAATDTEGRWTMRPERSVEPGTHQIRVDQVAKTGKVLARVQLPFVRARPFTDLPDGIIVIIQPGNNLWRIASRVYGSGLRYTEIYQANADQIRDPDLIYPGQVFGLPRTN